MSGIAATATQQTTFGSTDPASSVSGAPELLWAAPANWRHREHSYVGTETTCDDMSCWFLTFIQGPVGNWIGVDRARCRGAPPSVPERGRQTLRELPDPTVAAPCRGFGNPLSTTRSFLGNLTYSVHFTTLRGSQPLNLTVNRSRGSASCPGPEVCQPL